jgi:hypothetical protein
LTKRDNNQHTTYPQVSGVALHESIKNNATNILLFSISCFIYSCIDVDVTVVVLVIVISVAQCIAVALAFMFVAVTVVVAAEDIIGNCHCNRNFCLYAVIGLNIFVAFEIVLTYLDFFEIFFIF